MKIRHDGTMATTGVFRIGDQPDRPIAMHLSLGLDRYDQAAVVRSFTLDEAREMLQELTTAVRQVREKNA